MYKCEHCKKIVAREYCIIFKVNTNIRYRTCTQCDDEIHHDQTCYNCQDERLRRECKKRPCHERTCSNCDAKHSHTKCNNQGYELHDNKGRFICYGFENKSSVYCLSCEKWKLVMDGGTDSILRNLIK